MNLFHSDVVHYMIVPDLNAFSSVTGLIYMCNFSHRVENAFVVTICQSIQREAREECMKMKMFVHAKLDVALPKT